MAFKTGIVVQLKSGGSLMTIKGIIGDINSPLGKTEEFSLLKRDFLTGDIYCQWFDENNLKSECFKPHQLVEHKDIYGFI
jgi:uncharacterized protein YodC (DUF2158 family)